MIKTTNRALLAAKSIIEKLSRQSLPIKTSYWIAKAVIKVNAEFEVFDAQRLSLCEKYGEINPDANIYDITDTESFHREYNELLELEIELDMKPIELIEDVCLSAQELIAIKDLVKPFEEGGD